MQIAAQSLEFYSEDEPRDSHGRWTYTYEVQYAEDHEAMAKAQYKTTHVKVQADSEPEANLIAAQMGGRHGIPTATKLIDKTLTAAGYVEDDHPRGEHGRWVTLYHGTTERNAEAIMEGGFKPLDAHTVAQEVGEKYGVDPDVIYNHPWYEFARDRTERADPFIYFDKDPAVARSYAESRSETVVDALRTVYRIQHDEVDPTWPYSDAAKWAEQEAKKFGEPAILTVRIPKALAGNEETMFTPSELKQAKVGRTVVAAAPLEFDYNPDESRDQGGKWTSGAGGGAAAEKASIAQDRSFSPPGAHPWPLVPGQQQGTWAVGGAGYGGGPRKKLVCSPSTSPGGSGEPLPGRAQQPATSCVTDAQAQLILSTAADLQALYPLSPPLSIGVVSPEQATIDSGAGAMAYTDMAENHISIIVGTPATTNIHSDATNGLGERYATVDPIRYIIAHEYGHAQQPDSGLVTAIHDKVLALPQSGGLSGYGQGSAVEGYAEAFADYVCSGGKPTSDATRIYADTFGWKR